MTKKNILNDREVATNEDIQNNDEWNARTLYRLVEAIQSGAFTSTTGAAVVPGSIVAGFDLSFSATNLDVTVQPGSGFFSFPSVDPEVNGAVQMASLESDLTLSLPVASVTEYRWDLIEVASTKTTSAESRLVAGLGFPTTPTPTLVQKVEENLIQIRVRSGTPSATRTDALVPDLDLSDSWIPLFAVEVPPATLIATGLDVLDLRKIFGRIDHHPTSHNGSDYQVNLSSQGETVLCDNLSITLDSYSCLLSQVFSQDSTSRVLLNPNSVFSLSSGVTITPGSWYYVYAYRPSTKSGYSSLTISSVAPSAGLSTSPASPSGAFTLPAPFTTPASTPPAHYLGAVKFYQDGATLRPLPFRKYGGLTLFSSNSVAAFTGADTDGRLHPVSPLIAGGITTSITANPDGNGNQAVPPHVRTARLNMQFAAASTATSELTFRVLTGSEPFLIYTVNVPPSGIACPTLDVLLPDDGSTQIDIECGGLAIDVGTYRAWIAGFYEEIS